MSTLTEQELRTLAYYAIGVASEGKDEAYRLSFAGKWPVAVTCPDGAAVHAAGAAARSAAATSAGSGSAGRNAGATGGFARLSASALTGRGMTRGRTACNGA